MGLRPDSLRKAGMRHGSDEGGNSLSDLLLRMIWKLRRVSRADLARHADISRSTVSRGASFSHQGNVFDRQSTQRATGAVSQTDPSWWNIWPRGQNSQ